MANLPRPVCPPLSHAGIVVWKRIHIVKLFTPSVTKFQGNSHPHGGIKYAGMGKHLRLSTEIAVYLGNGMR